MKIGKRLPLLIEQLERLSLVERSVMVTRAGFEDCRITRGRDLLDCTVEQGYLATIVVRPGGFTGSERG